MANSLRSDPPGNVAGAANGLSMSVFRKIPYARPLAITISVILIYAVIGFVVVPRLIVRAVPDYVAEHLQRKATIGKVRFHPFIFKLDVRIALLSFALALVFGWALQTEFFPPTDNGIFFAKMEALPGTSIDATREYIARDA